jgi:ABC-type amino acid transport substrate-binding protein
MIVMGTALVSIAFGLTASLFATGASAQATLNSVKQKGFLTCGSNTGAPGFGAPDVNQLRNIDPGRGKRNRLNIRNK